MARVNTDYLRLQSNYLFAEVSERVAHFQQANPGADVIRLGIGDVTQPLAPAIIHALHDAVDDMSRQASFKGYAPYEGYEFLRESIAKNDYANRGVDISASEVFVSDGAKSDTANLQELFSRDSVVAVTNPVYPVYVDSNIMSGRADIVYLPCTSANGFVPELPSSRVDLIYLCYPNNPTGAVASKDQLTAWVDYARRNKSVIIFDAAYEAYISDPGIPHSIFEIEGAREVAIECRSFSKTAGFTGTRCGYSVVPKELMAYDDAGGRVGVSQMWLRRQSTKYNGTAYIVQAGAAAVYSEEGQKQIRQTIEYYMNNAQVIIDGLREAGIDSYGGTNAPYIWLKTPSGMTSWQFFDKLLSEIHVVGTPGSGFGSAGEGYFRLTAFGDRTRTMEAVDRIKGMAL